MNVILLYYLHLTKINFTLIPKERVIKQTDVENRVKRFARFF